MDQHYRFMLGLAMCMLRILERRKICLGKNLVLEKGKKLDLLRPLHDAWLRLLLLMLLLLMDTRPHLLFRQTQFCCLKELNKKETRC